MKGYTPEYILSRQVSTYLRLQYPKVIFHYDLSGLNHTKAQAGMSKAIQCGKGWPDLFIAEPRGEYYGLFIELKAEGVNVFKRDGSFTSPHVAEQYGTLKMMRERKYMAVFCIGFDESKQIIDAYLRQ